MAQIVIALGSNLGNRFRELNAARRYLSFLSIGKTHSSPIYESEPVGPSEFSFLNAVVSIESHIKPESLLSDLKKFEIKRGRDPHAKKWSARLLDMDIITYGNLVIQTENLIIPHPSYRDRLFVLKPIRDLFPNWKDPENGAHIDTLITEAPDIDIQKLENSWGNDESI